MNFCFVQEKEVILLDILVAFACLPFKTFLLILCFLITDLYARELKIDTRMSENEITADLIPSRLDLLIKQNTQNVRPVLFHSLLDSRAQGTRRMKVNFGPQTLLTWSLSERISSSDSSAVSSNRSFSLASGCPVRK